MLINSIDKQNVNKFNNIQDNFIAYNNGFDFDNLSIINHKWDNSKCSVDTTSMSTVISTEQREYPMET